jgi:hypothetical protein
MMMQTFKMLIVPFWLTALIAVACIKETNKTLPNPVMQYTDLHEKEIKANQYIHIDIDKNGSTDFSFYTQLVGDPLLQRDRVQFLVGSKIATNLLSNSQDESPKFNKGDRIALRHEGYNWFEISSIVLAEKLIPLNEAAYWDGTWKRANHNYLPVQLIKNGHTYQGWIEISFDIAGQKLILHKAGISTESEKDIAAGY